MIILLGSLNTGKNVGSVNFCAVDWIIKPNWLRYFKRKALEVKFPWNPWIPGIYEGWVTLLTLLPDPFKL